MAAPRAYLSKRKIAAVFAGVAAFAIISASAATLGGLFPGALGADTDEVTSPVTQGVTLTWSTKYAAEAAAGGPGYVVTDVQLTPVDPDEEITEDLEVKVTLAGETGSLGEFAHVPDPSGAATDPYWTTIPAGISAEAITNASVVIEGQPVAVAPGE